LRRLVRERCDAAAFIPMKAAMESLNVSVAAAIALYELSGRAAQRNPSGDLTL
jgi:23S rRNA (guanosine2251-2'-O)-methyltransferase